MPQPLRLSTASPHFEADLKGRLHWSADTDAAIEQRVADILADVKQRGDVAVMEYTERFDSLKATSMAALELTQAELKTAFDGLPAVQRTALEAAAARVRSYHEAQKKPAVRAGHTAMRTALCWDKSHAARPRRYLCTRWQGGLSIQRVDECHSSACGGCARHHHGGTNAT